MTLTTSLNKSLILQFFERSPLRNCQEKHAAHILVNDAAAQLFIKSNVHIFYEYL